MILSTTVSRAPDGGCPTISITISSNSSEFWCALRSKGEATPIFLVIMAGELW
jgi:hypothetical protein